MPPKRTQFTRRSSQIMTVLEVVVQTSLGIVFWFMGWKIAAMSMLLLSCWSLVCFHKRVHKDD